MRFRPGSYIQAVCLASDACARRRDSQGTAGLDLHASARFRDDRTAVYNGQCACPGDLYGVSAQHSEGMPICIDGHGFVRQERGAEALILLEYKVSFQRAGAAAQHLGVHPIYLVQQGGAGRQVHLLLLAAGQLLIQSINFAELGLDLFRVVGGDAGGQLADQSLNGADRADKGARCAGVFRDIAADAVVFVGAGQRLNDTAAVLCARVGAQRRLPRPVSVARVRVTPGRMGMDTVSLCDIAAIVVAVGTFLPQDRRSVPA